MQPIALTGVSKSIHLLSTPRWSAAESAVLRLGVRAPQGMRNMGPLEGVLSPLVEEPPPRSEGLSLLALLGGFLDALMVAACRIVLQSLATYVEFVTVLFVTVLFKL